MSSAFSDCTSMHALDESALDEVETSVGHSSWDHCGLGSQDEHARGPISSYSKPMPINSKPFMNKLLRGASKLTLLASSKKKRALALKSSSSPSLASSTSKEDDHDEDIPPVPSIPHQEVRVPVYQNAPPPLVFHFPPLGGSLATKPFSQSSVDLHEEKCDPSPYFLDRKPAPFFVNSQTARYASSSNIAMSHTSNTSLPSNFSVSTSSGSGRDDSLPSSSTNSSVDLRTPIDTHFPNLPILPLNLKGHHRGDLEPLVIPLPPSTSTTQSSPVEDTNHQPFSAEASDFASPPSAPVKAAARERTTSGLRSKLRRRRDSSQPKRPSTAPGGSVGKNAFKPHYNVARKEGILDNWIDIEVSKATSIPPSGSASPSKEEQQPSKTSSHDVPMSGTNRASIAPLESPMEIRDTHAIPTWPALVPLSNPTSLMKQQKRNSKRLEKRPSTSPGGGDRNSSCWSDFSKISPPPVATREPTSRTMKPTTEKLMKPSHLRPSPPPFKVFDNDPGNRQSLLRIKRVSCYGDWDVLPPPSSPPPACPLPNLPSEWLGFED